MMHVDTHTHLYVEEFDSDRELMLERAVMNAYWDFRLAILKIVCP